MTIRINEQLQLRTYQPYDAPELYRCVDKNRAHLREFLPWVNTTLRAEHSLEFIRNALVQETAQQALTMGIFLNDQLVGGIGMYDWNHYLKKAQIGYWLDKNHEGRGLMLQCTTALITFLFHNVGLNKIEIHFLPYNTRSSELTKRLGAKVEGVLRDSILLNGAYEDVVVTGILRREWK
jgi:ribosomal-protein-serine acetyltransferase